LISVTAAAGAIALSIVVIALSGIAPDAAIRALYDGAFGGQAQIGGTLAKTAVLILVSLGWIVAFSVRRVNIGLEGQILAGGILATIVGVSTNALPALIHLPLALAASAIGGAAWAGIAAVLWARRGVNEVISTLMLNLIAMRLVNWLVRGPLQEVTHTFPRSMPVAPNARWPHLLPNTALGWDLVLALALAVAVGVLLARTTFGFRLRLIGANPEAALHAGIAVQRTTVVALLLSGALAGIAGGSLILASETGSMADNFSANYGYDGIVAALLARNAPLAAIPASLLLGALRQGGGLLEARVGVSSALILITQGAVIAGVAGAAVLARRYRARRVDVDVPLAAPTERTSTAAVEVA
jgi:simple sugar transport system permease protein